MKVLVAGGAGYIGGTTTRLFEEAGHEAVVFDNLTTGHRNNIDKAKLIVGDLLDTKAIESVFKKHKFDVVLDFAAKIQVEESVRLPRDYYENNVVGPINLLDVCTKYGVKNFIFSSSAAVYGNTGSAPVKESDQTLPTSPYGWGKLLVEQILKGYEQTHQLNWLAFRYFNVAGAYKDIGPDYPFMTHLISSIINSLLTNGTFEVFGGNYDTIDGTGVRDYIHVYDVARAHVLAAEKAVSRASFMQPINLGTDKGCSVLQLIEAVERNTKQKVKYKITKRRAGDPAMSIADNHLAKRVLSWSPTKSIDDIVADAYTWMKKRANNNSSSLS